MGQEAGRSLRAELRVNLQSKTEIAQLQLSNSTVSKVIEFVPVEGVGSSSASSTYRISEPNVFKRMYTYYDPMSADWFDATTSESTQGGVFFGRVKDAAGTYHLATLELNMNDSKGLGGGYNNSPVSLYYFTGNRKQMMFPLDAFEF